MVPSLLTSFFSKKDQMLPVTEIYHCFDGFCSPCPPAPSVLFQISRYASGLNLSSEVRPVIVVAKHIAMNAGVLVAIPGPVNSDRESSTSRHRYDVSSEQCCSGAKPRRCIPPLVTRFGTIMRVS